MASVKTKRRDGSLIYYRDVRLWMMGVLMISLPLFYAGIFLEEGAGRWTPLALGVAAPTLGAFVIMRVFHGAIKLNQGLRQVEEFKDWNYENPAVVIRSSQISRVELRLVTQKGHQLFLQYYNIVLVLKSGAERKLDLKFFDQSIATEATRAIGEFAKASN